MLLLLTVLQHVIGQMVSGAPLSLVEFHRGCALIGWIKVLPCQLSYAIKIQRRRPLAPASKTSELSSVWWNQPFKGVQERMDQPGEDEIFPVLDGAGRHVAVKQSLELTVPRAGLAHG